MPLVLGHVRLDLGQLPHLMPQGFGIAAGEFLAAAATCGRLERLHVVAVLGGQQRTLMFLVPRLSAALLLRFTLGQGRFGMGMHAAGRQRGVLGRFSPAFQLLDACLQLGNLRQQQADDGLGLRRLTGDDFFRDSERHALDFAEICPRVQINSAKIAPRGVNGYLLGL